MLQFINRQDNGHIWINPQQVSAVVHSKQDEGLGCTLLMAGGFEIQIQQTAEEVSGQINKRLRAY